ncbi:hypothetical protein ACQ4LE_009107 [Meloidogyne hapla]|uniref:MFS domain-containing protein n=1 Tax=Meloidogyne hapla TaxID=6305 RepID=A0A1I8B9T7_MELHA
MSIHSSTNSPKSPSLNDKNDNNNNIDPPTSEFSPSTKMAHYTFPSSPDCALDLYQQKPLAKQKQTIMEIIFPIRFVILALSLGCLSLIVANSLALNFTVICMHKELPLMTDDDLHWEWTILTNTNISSTNNEENSKEQQLESMFTVNEQSWLFSAIAIGQLFGTLPITYFMTNIGLRKMFTLYGLISSFSTLFIPISIDIAGFPGLMVMRILQGVSLATVMVVTGAVSAEWSPLSSAGVFLTILTINYQLGPITAMPLAAALCSSETFGWQSIYYLLGVLSFFGFAIFFYFFRDTPREQKFVSVRELEIIEKGKIIEKSQKREGSQKERIPYKAIFLDPVFWAITTSNATANMAFQVFWQYGPLYLNKVLGIEVAETGIAAALPYILSTFVKLIAAQISDKFNCVSEKCKVILFASVSQYVMCCCFLAMALLPKMGFMNVMFMQCMFTASTVFSGLNAVGVVKSTHLVSRQFSHVLFSWDTLTLAVVSLLLPLGINFLTPTHSVDEWANVFLFVTACNMVGTTFFNIYAEVEPREWTKGHITKSSLTYPESIGIEESKKFGLPSGQLP